MRWPTWTRIANICLLLRETGTEIDWPEISNGVVTLPFHGFQTKQRLLIFVHSERYKLSQSWPLSKLVPLCCCDFAAISKKGNFSPGIILSHTLLEMKVVKLIIENKFNFNFIFTTLKLQYIKLKFILESSILLNLYFYKSKIKTNFTSVLPNLNLKNGKQT